MTASSPTCRVSWPGEVSQCANSQLPDLPDRQTPPETPCIPLLTTLEVATFRRLVTPPYARVATLDRSRSYWMIELMCFEVLESYNLQNQCVEHPEEK